MTTVAPQPQSTDISNSSITLLQVSLVTGSVVSEFPIVVQNTMNDILIISIR